jgi:hypothetical protein
MRNHLSAQLRLVIAGLAGLYNSAFMDAGINGRIQVVSDFC